VATARPHCRAKIRPAIIRREAIMSESGMSESAPVSPSSRLSSLVAGNRIYIQLGVLFVVGLLLTLALQQIDIVVTERSDRHETAVKEISNTWGAEQRLAGPVLTVPYLYIQSHRPGSGPQEAQAFFLPDRLDITAKMVPEVRHRGIFEAIVYKAKLQVSGTFRRADFRELATTASEVLWDRAAVAVGVSDLRGTGGEPRLTWAGSPVPFEPGTGGVPLGTGMHAPVAAAQGETIDFAFELEIAGSRSLRVTPLGRSTTAELAGSWPHPSFTGAYLPASHQLGPDGFQAKWTISHLGRAYPQSWTSLDDNGGGFAKAFTASQFGVGLVQPVDFYLVLERSVKYGLLAIVLIFASIFIFEVVAPLRVHPLQYGLVGCVLCVHYLLLISIAEIIGFSGAYLLAAGLSVGLIGLYVWRILGSRGRALGLSAILVAVYLFLFVILRLEAYALLAGSLGLFMALGAIMYATRKIDWYAIGRAETHPRPKGTT
jgi:inner membrane protein